MFFTIFIVAICLIGLLIIHELGHFILAKKFGVGVEEFGVGLPPRIFGKKFGETIYSINLLPFGAFVKITGEDGEGEKQGKEGEKKIVNPQSFSQKPIYQRALIIFGGCVSFWLVAFLLFTFVAGTWGLLQAVSDDFSGPSQVQIIEVAKNSPAEISGIKPGDEILGFKTENKDFIKTNKVKEVQEFTGAYLGKEITLNIKRGKEILDINLTPRLVLAKGEGAMGVGLARVSRLKTAWYQAPIIGVSVTIENTIKIPIVLAGLLEKSLKGEKIEGVELKGPIGVGAMLGQALNTGADKFLMFLAMLSLWMALFNLLPIPALDGGKLLFLAIEAIQKKPVSQKIEQGITAFFFALLLGLMLFVTIKDIMSFFKL
ncbi:site-2 protease family protein [Patescibacteria group bacterium]|nr:site-2 protease family protein [Patescibacteria group bacterium]